MSDEDHVDDPRLPARPFDYEDVLPTPPLIPDEVHDILVQKTHRDYVNVWIWGLVMALMVIGAAFAVFDRHHYFRYVVSGERPQVAVVAHDEKIPPMVAMQPAPVPDEVSLPSIITDGVKDLDRALDKLDTQLDTVHAALDAVPLEPVESVIAPITEPALSPFARLDVTPPPKHKPLHHHHRRAPEATQAPPKMIQFQLGVAAGVLTLPQ